MYSLFMKLRNYLYDRGVLPVRRLPIPVVSVGNLSVGGSGKTSLVRHICEELADRYRLCVVLRGYGRKSRGLRLVSDGRDIVGDVVEVGDEAYMLSRFLRSYGVGVVVSEDRYEGGMYAYEELKAQLIILDDGFQHRRLFRDIDIVLLRKRDLSDRLLPFGRLREPLSSLERASCVVLSYQESEPFEFSFGDKPVFRMFREFNTLLSADFERLPLEELYGKELTALAALGDNGQFFRTLERLGLRVARRMGFRDHHDYRNFRPMREEIYITTPKDLVKLPKLPNLYALDMRLRVEGLTDFITAHL
jgi:tetraacyldisaccharide 4'-kinase